MLPRHADLTTVVDSPMGRRSIGEGLSFPAVDLFVHGWDLARSVGAEGVIPPEASPQVKFLAWAGRDATAG
jgi:hypothetical protein